MVDRFNDGEGSGDDRTVGTGLTVVAGESSVGEPWHASECIGATE